MEEYEKVKAGFDKDGFVIVSNIFPAEEVEEMLNLIASASTDRPAFRKATGLFAIRQFLTEIPETRELIFTEGFRKLIHGLFGGDYFVVKSIYFDKPPASNWFVSYHQDLTVAVNQKEVMEGFDKWTIKQHQYAVQPPVAILQNNFTVRIHLDDTDKHNGALKVIPGSHVKGIVRTETIDLIQAGEQTCEVKKGGVMLMRPLLLHASDKTMNTGRRRVIHIEFSKSVLPAPLQWQEYLATNR